MDYLKLPGRQGWLILVSLLVLGWVTRAQASELPLDTDWRFILADVPQAEASGFDDRSWASVTLPHTAQLAPLADGHQPRLWQGICWYRKSFELPASAAGKEVFLRFDGAMNTAGIWVNGEPAGKFMGAYLPYVMDITKFCHVTGTNRIAVRLDNRDNAITGPKPLADLDFNLYGGLYRHAHLILQDPLHITDPILADKPAGGGVFVSYPVVTGERAIVAARTEVRNDAAVPRTFAVRSTLVDRNGKTVAMAELPAQLAAGADAEYAQQLPVREPRLWSPHSPNLYSLHSELVEQGTVVDATQTRLGIRRLQITPAGFFINGEKMFLRGCNRHQEYPFLGNALPDAAQYRDARKIKEAGFDYVRLSHYPQSPAFLDACDELGLVVMDGILGWQYFNPDPAFAAEKYQEGRQLIRRDRNHPCVVLWEMSLNESDMPKPFIQAENAIAHAEYPGDQCFTAGWERGYDVFLQARQHGGCRSITNVPCLISEYGDWEYYAQNAGLEQGKWKDLEPAERSSRQLRGDGEARMLQQARNFQEAHNDNLQTPAFGDGIWVMFDYSRGYAPDLESSGVMDVFRLPKFSYWFFRSQRDADERVAGDRIGPVLFIASDGTTHSSTDVSVFSNCDELALYLNGQLVERRRPDASRISTHLKHPPFIFHVPQFQAGTLRAEGFIQGHKVAEAERRTPGSAVALAVQFDLSGRAFAAEGRDAVFFRATLTDQNGTPVPLNGARIFGGTTGALQLVEQSVATTEAGIASLLVAGQNDRASAHGSDGLVYALCLLNEAGQTRILSAGASPDGKPVPAGEIHYTVDGSEPTLQSPVYSGLVEDPPQLRAAVFVNGIRVAAGTP